jgi:hypothetical protein
MADRPAMNKKTYPRPIADLVGRALSDVFARQGFASVDLVTHWPEIVGDEIANLAEPLKIQWSREDPAQGAEPATLLLRVEGPAAIEIQHLTPVILERVNQFLGWKAIGRIRLRQAPNPKPAPVVRKPPPSAAETAAVAATLGMEEGGLRDALARLGAAVKRK